MSSRSEAVRHWAAAGLFVVCCAASAILYRGPTPLRGAPATPPAFSAPVDRAVGRLGRALRPNPDITFCRALRAYLPDRLPWIGGDEAIDAAPRRPVVICLDGALDSPAAVARAGRDGLSWVRGIDGERVIAFARDEADFHRVMTAAGADVPAAALRPLSPMLGTLQAGEPRIHREGAGWAAPAHADDGLVLFGPYMDLTPGAYTVRLHVTLSGSAETCRADASAFHPTLAVTRDAGAAELRASTPVSTRVDPDSPCGLTLSDRFVVGPGGARKVETPFRAPSRLPYVVDGYGLEPEAAQAR